MRSDPEDPKASDLDVIARRCFEHERLEDSPKVDPGVPVFMVIATLFVFHLLVFPVGWWPSAMGLFLATLFPFASVAVVGRRQLSALLSAIVAFAKSPSHVSRQMTAYRLHEGDAVVRVCSFAMQEFRQQIASGRERLLAKDSNQARKRGEIRHAADGAKEAVNYWNERALQAAADPAVQERLDAATRVSQELKSALESLEGSVKMIEHAYDDCSYRIDTMEQQVNNLERIRQFGDLAGRSRGGQAVVDASEKEIAAELFEEAESVGVAIANILSLKVSETLEAAGDNVEQPRGEAVDESEQDDKVTAGPDLTVESRPSPATVAPAPPEEPSEPPPRPIEIPKVTPMRPRPIRASTRSTSPSIPATMSDAEEERQMKELVVSLRRMAEIQERRAHDLKFRDDGNSEADDREELAEKMTDLADDIDTFFAVKERMKEWRAQNS